MLQVELFAGDYAAIADVYESTPTELVLRDQDWGGPVLRWVAYRSGNVAAVIAARERPDGRLFVALQGDPAAYGPLIRTVAGESDRHLYASVTDRQPDLERVLTAAGFVTEVQAEVFVVEFNAAIASLRRASVPGGFAILSADEADPFELFELDNAVRSRVPGTDGWQGRWSWFVGELEDPAAYLVAVDRAGRYAGLARIWRNQGRPRFGLIGIRESYHHSRIGPALLRQVLVSGAEWGHKDFTAETAATNRFLHARLGRLATQGGGLRRQLVRHGTRR